MKNLTNLLERIKRSLGQDTDVRQNVIACVEKIVEFTISREDVSINGNTLSLKNLTNVKKNEIKLNEEDILSEINMCADLRLERILYL